MQEKLKNQQGAALVMALLFLLAATLISCLVLTAALSDAGIRQKDSRHQQAFLDVSSAAQMLKKQMTASCVEVGKDPERQVDGPLEVRAILTALVEALSEGQATYSFCIRSPQPRMGIVDVTVSMDVHYNLTLTLQSREQTQPCRLVLRLPARQEETGRYVWPEADAVITRGEGI